jgi:hypothetical protein
LREFVVFYAWQSDRPGRTNRFLIRTALEQAAKFISADAAADVLVRIDADTEGVLGHVPVADTIIKKISGCDAFVSDLTFVAVTSGGKYMPNPNVMLEYGYALRAVSHSFLLPVMNIEYGPAEKLPFDMGHLRHPIKFDLPETAENERRRSVRQVLSAEFERILRLMIAAPSGRPGTAFAEAKPANDSPAFFFQRGTTLAEGGKPGEQPIVFEGDSAIYLRLFPKNSDNQPRVGRAKLKNLFYAQRRIAPMANVSDGLVSRNDYGWINCDISSNNATKGVTQGFDSGELWGLNSKVFVRGRIDHYNTEDIVVGLGSISAERIFTRTLEKYISIAVGDMDMKFPFIVELGAVGLKNCYLGAPNSEVGSSYYGPIKSESLIERYELRAGGRSDVFEVLRQYFEGMYDLVDCYRAELLTDEIVKTNDLPSRYPA